MKHTFSQWDVFVLAFLAKLLAVLIHTIQHSQLLGR